MLIKKFERQTKFAMLLLPFLVGACAPQKFNPIPSVQDVVIQVPQTEEISSNFFQLSKSQVVFDQENLDQNQTSLMFQIRLPDGSYLKDLQASDLVLTENGVPVPQFQLNSNSQNIVQTVDIVLVVDVTGSMTSTIESAKSRLIRFVQKSRDRGYHTRLCLLTFGDYIVQNCNRFYDNNPSDPQTLSQVQELISEVSKLRAISGFGDPGGSDMNENSMRALIEASLAPWSPSSQRFAILVTDDGFLYSPGNQGAVGNLAPRYNEVLTALENSRMQVFAATPSLAGYSQPFRGQPGVVQASGGEFFLFEDLINGRITLDTILDRILNRVQTTFLATYNVDEVPGLDPELPLKQRDIRVELRNGVRGQLSVNSVQSNLPDGRRPYRKKWKLSGRPIHLPSLEVRINRQPLNGGYQLAQGEIEFVMAPPKGSKIEMSFQYESLRDNLSFVPVTLEAKVDLSRLTIYFNGRQAGPSDFVIERNLEGSWTLQPSDLALSAADPFSIRRAGGLEIRIVKR
jgi:hypothetical protein